MAWRARRARGTPERTVRRRHRRDVHCGARRAVLRAEGRWRFARRRGTSRTRGHHLAAAARRQRAPRRGARGLGAHGDGAGLGVSRQRTRRPHGGAAHQARFTSAPRDGTRRADRARGERAASGVVPRARRGERAAWRHADGEAHRLARRAREAPRRAHADRRRRPAIRRSHRERERGGHCDPRRRGAPPRIARAQHVGSRRGREWKRRADRHRRAAPRARQRAPPHRRSIPR